MIGSLYTIANFSWISFGLYKEEIQSIFILRELCYFVGRDTVEYSRTRVSATREIIEVICE